MTDDYRNLQFSVAGGAELRARPLQVLRHAHQQRLAVGYRVVELLDRDVERGQRAFLDSAVLETLQRVAQDGVGFRLHLVEFVDRIGVARGREHVEQPVALRGVDVALVLLQIAGEPGADGSDRRRRHQAPPDVIAVAVEEGLFLAVDKGRGAGMNRDRGVLVGIGRFDLGGQREFVLQRLADRKQLPVKMAMVDSGMPRRATMWCEKLMVLTLPRAGPARRKRAAGISEAS